ncbi:MAG: hypothetical protein NC184_01195 [Roseburia sp.]|nr:hypothetical protein [Roseburia sp.]
MKKIIISAAALALSGALLCGCSSGTANDASYDVPEAPREARAVEDFRPSSRREFTVEIEGASEARGGFFRSPISGVRRRFAEAREGVYTVEYVHAPQGAEKDDTLDYRLELRDDNTFDLAVTADGVSVSHNGHWYARRHEIMLFYDEDVDPTAHNIYVCDSMYGDILPQGKIMIYDNCNIIVLSRVATDTTAD